MRLFTANQMRSADAAAIQMGIPALVLMENAGRRVAETATRHWPAATHITVLCGKGNNGGDGYVAARHLVESGHNVKVLELAREGEMPTTEEARQARTSLLAHLPSIETLTPQTLSVTVRESELIIDALFGSGLSRPLAGNLAAIIKTANDAPVPVLSVDVPSGVSSDNPLLIGPHIEADRTLQLAGPKLSSAFYPARSAFGTWEVATIGIPETVLETQSQTRLLTDTDATRHLPIRDDDVHKYSAGTVTVLAGSPEYLGAAELACRAAYRAGAGLVTLAAEVRMAGSWPEIVFWPLNWQKKPLETLASLAEKAAQSLVIGPGLTKQAEAFIPSILSDRTVPSVLDASALVPNAGLRQAVKNHGRCVLTPHLGEAALLLGTRASDVRADPLTAATHLAADWGAIVVLKGATTVIASPENESAVSTRGHPGMATGGSGDVLAGLLGAWLTGIEHLYGRTCAAVTVHGLAGELAGAENGYGLTAGDLIAKLPKAWQALTC